jgi:hypothetical protein
MYDAGVRIRLVMFGSKVPTDLLYTDYRSDRGGGGGGYRRR